MSEFKSEICDGMRIDWDVPIEMDDGLVLRADAFRPIEEGKYPVIMTYGPYAKWGHFQDSYPYQWKSLTEQHPEVTAGSTCKYQQWEVVDPEKWVPDGYVCVRVDSRGAGRSPGFVDPWSPRETKDLYDCIEWAGVQPWSNGKVGLNGISYYAMNQWQVASLQPPHLAAMCAWEGAADFYRDMGYHGGILCRFSEIWYPRRLLPKQLGWSGIAPARQHRKLRSRRLQREVARNARAPAERNGTLTFDQSGVRDFQYSSSRGCERMSLAKSHRLASSSSSDSVSGPEIQSPFMRLRSPRMPRPCSLDEKDDPSIHDQILIPLLSEVQRLPGCGCP